MADRTEEKRSRLFETTRDLILQSGIQGASMSKISKAAQLPMGTIYALYPAKEDLINAAYAFCRGNYLGSIDFAACWQAGDGRAVVYAAVQAYIDAALAHDKDFLFVEQCYLDPVIRKEVISDGDDVLRGFGLTFSGENNAETVYLIKHMALSVIHKAIALALTGRIALDAAERARVAEACWNILTDGK
ncbi:TetR/AcrR family transcriptional regulator [Gemmiger sp.]